MNLKNQPPIFVPPEHVTELEKISKAALMDMVWDYAETKKTPHDNFTASTIEELRSHRDMVLGYRKRERMYSKRVSNCISIVSKKEVQLFTKWSGDKL